MPSPLTAHPGTAWLQRGKPIAGCLLYLCLSLAPVHAQAPWPPVADPQGGSQWATESPVRYEPATFDEIPGWRDDNLLASLRGLRQSCAALAGYDTDWSAPCAELAALGPDSELVRQYYQRNFVAYRIAASNRPSLAGIYDPLAAGPGAGMPHPPPDQYPGNAYPRTDESALGPPGPLPTDSPASGAYGTRAEAVEAVPPWPVTERDEQPEQAWKSQERDSMSDQEAPDRPTGAERILGAALQLQQHRNSGRAEGVQNGLEKIVELQRRWKEAKGFLGSLGLGPRTRGQRGPAAQAKPLSDEELHRLLASLESESSPRVAQTPRPPPAKVAPRTSPAAKPGASRNEPSAIRNGQQQEEVAAYIAALSRPAAASASTAERPDPLPEPAPVPSPSLAPTAASISMTDQAAMPSSLTIAAEPLQVNPPSTKPMPHDGPIGTLGVPLTAGRSLSVTPGLVPPGSPVFIDAGVPGTQARLQRLVFAQDSRPSTVGQPETTLFWGSGETAQRLTETTGGPVQMWLLVPKGASPGS